MGYLCGVSAREVALIRKEYAMRAFLCTPVCGLSSLNPRKKRVLCCHDKACNGTGHRFSPDLARSHAGKGCDKRYSSPVKSSISKKRVE